MPNPAKSRTQKIRVVTPLGTHVEYEVPATTPDHVMTAIEAGCIIALALAFTIVAFFADFGPITERLADALFYVERV